MTRFVREKEVGGGGGRINLDSLGRGGFLVCVCVGGVLCVCCVCVCVGGGGGEKRELL